MEQIKSIGLVINELRQEKRISVAHLAAKFNLTRQAIYDTFGKRTTMSMGDMKRWADALGVDVQYLIDATTGQTSSTRQASNAFADEVLNSIKKMLEDELKEKNEQIKALQEALKESQQLSRVLLGKSPERSEGRILFNVFARDETPAAIA